MAQGNFPIESLESRIHLNGGGSIDTTFAAGAKGGKLTVDFNTALTLGVSAGTNRFILAHDSGGRIYAATTAQTSAPAFHPEPVISRFSRDGVIDKNFGVDGFRVLGDGQVQAVFVDPNNRTYVLCSGNLLWRLTPSGKIDRSFGRGGKLSIPLLIPLSASSIAFDAAGRAYIGGSTKSKIGSRMAVMRIDDAGNLDTSWATLGLYLSPVPGVSSSSQRSSYVITMRFLPNGELAVLGSMSFQRAGITQEGAWETRLTAQGAVDLSYGFGGYAARSYPVDSLGQIFVDASALAPDGAALFSIEHSDFSGTGELTESDYTFSADGQSTSDFKFQNFSIFSGLVMFQPDGKILASDSGQVVRFNPDGTRDSTWALPITVSDSNGTFDLQPDGSVLVLQPQSNPLNLSKVDLWRLFRDDAPLAQFDGRTLTKPRSTATRFTVIWRDDDGVNQNSIDSSDIRVSGPFNGRQSTRSAALESVQSLSDGRFLATYKLTSPGGSTADDDGDYVVRLMSGQIEDVVGNFAPAGPLGAFRVHIE